MSLQLDLMECVLDAFDSIGHLTVSGHYVCGSLNSPRMTGRVRALALGINPAFLSGVAKMLQSSALNKVTITLDAYPVMNPYGVPPPGMPYMERRECLIVRNLPVLKRFSVALRPDEVDSDQEKQDGEYQ